MGPLQINSPCPPMVCILSPLIALFGLSSHGIFSISFTYHSMYSLLSYPSPEGLPGPRIYHSRVQISRLTCWRVHRAHLACIMHVQCAVRWCEHMSVVVLSGLLLVFIYTLLLKCSLNSRGRPLDSLGHPGLTNTLGSYSLINILKAEPRNLGPQVQMSCLS
jgi:hypothetical protein